VAYEMLGEETLTDEYEIDAVTHNINVRADSQDILEDVSIDPDTETSKDLMLVDGDPGNEDTGYQEETQNDGATAYDIGVGFGGNQDLLNNDGTVDVRLQDD
jgi:hypothetical protein